MQNWLREQQLSKFSWYSSTSEAEQEVDPEFKKPKISKLSLVDLHSVFVLGSLGVYCSVIVFIIEILRFLQKFSAKKYQAVKN